jgi:hypothetical protein
MQILLHKYLCTQAEERKRRIEAPRLIPFHRASSVTRRGNLAAAHATGELGQEIGGGVIACAQDLIDGKLRTGDATEAKKVNC